MTLRRLPPTLPTTRRGLHLITFYAFSLARKLVDGEFWLVPMPNGLGTPPFDGRVLRFDGVEMVDEIDGAEVRRAPITNLQAALDFAGVEFDVPRGERNDVELPYRLDETFELDHVAVEVMSEFLLTGDRVLQRVMEEIPDAGGTAVRLWPEHFDLAIETGSEEQQLRASAGFSPGDAHIAEPYVYVSPWWKDTTAERLASTAPFGGVALTYTELLGVTDPLQAAYEFLSESLSKLR